MQEIFFSTWLNVLLIFVPLAILADLFGWGDLVLFIFSCIGLISLSERLTYVTEQISLYTTPTIGGLLNATFANLGELVFVFLAISEGAVRLTQLFLLGSILGNLLLVLGVSFLLGGAKYYQQTFPRQGTLANMAILLLGTTGLIVPAVLNITTAQATPQAQFATSLDILQISRITSVILIVFYIAYLYFQLVSHVNLFSEEEKEAKTKMHKSPLLGFWPCIAWLTVVAVFIAFLADYIVGTAALVAVQLSLPQGFLAVILLPVVANVAEHSSAVIFAWRDEVAICISISIGSATQIIAFLLPAAVLLGWVLNQPMNLDFEAFETAILFVTIISASIIVLDGRSNWFKGAVLLLIYSVVATGFWFHPVDLTD